MSTRREFLRRTSLALAGGLLLGDAALELFDRLTHRKVWAGADLTSPLSYYGPGFRVGDYVAVIDSDARLVSNARYTVRSVNPLVLEHNISLRRDQLIVRANAKDKLSKPRPIGVTAMNPTVPRWAETDGPSWIPGLDMHDDRAWLEAIG